MSKYFKYFNPNPTKRVSANGKPQKWHKGDCAVRAICSALGISWEKAFTMMCELGMEMYDMPNSDKVIEKILTTNGYVRKSVKDMRVKPTVNEFIKNHKDGQYVVFVCGHVASVVEGSLCDVWDCGEWKVTRFYEKVA